MNFRTPVVVFGKVLVLSYLRCLEMQDGGTRVTMKMLFEQEHRWVTILFLWTMLTMGSGTAFIGLGLLSLYFIRKQTAIYMILLLGILLYMGQALEMKQMDRVLRVTQVTMTGDVNEIASEDGSAAVRIIPIVNTLTKMDLTDKDTWFGKGTSIKNNKNWWKQKDQKIGMIEQYGLIAFMISLILVYSCMIKHLFSIETLIYIFLFAMSLGNIYYTWGAMMVFTAVRYFQEQNENRVFDCRKGYFI